MWDSKGQMTVKRGTSRVPLPAGPEELRRRLNIMRNVYLMLKLKFPGRSDLQDLTPELFERYKEYLLGDYVYNLQARDSSDNVVHTPPWQLVLAYEQAVRKQAFHYMVLDSLSIAAAWEKAWKDPVTKERHFSTPLSLYSKRKPADPTMPTRDTWVPRGSGKGQKGQKGHKGRGRGAGRIFKGHAATRTGEPICFRFNTEEGCNLANCKFKHVCSHCFDSSHNFIACAKRKPADTSGKH